MKKHLLPKVELQAMLGNDKIFNYNFRSRLYIWTWIISLVAALILDFVVFPDDIVTIAYVPFFVMTGIVFRNPFVIAFLSGLVSAILTFDTHGELNTNVAFVRWISFFLASFVISTLIQNLYKERESLLVLASTLSQSLDAKDDYTSFHSKNVAYYSFEIGKAMKLPKEDCLNLYLGGLFHDIGKISIPDGILNKPSRLTDDEFSIVKSHPEKGYEILKDVPYLQKNGILDMVLYHHERFDGKGYPHQKEGYNIPKVARIMAVADSFDAMTSKRIYRGDLDISYAIEELKKGKGTQFDTEMVNVFLELLNNKKIEIKGFCDREEAKKKETSPIDKQLIGIA